MLPIGNGVSFRRKQNKEHLLCENVVIPLLQMTNAYIIERQRVFMEEQRNPEENGWPQRIQDTLVLVIILVSIGWFFLEELYGYHLYLFEIATASIIVCLVLAVYRLARRTPEESIQPFVVSPVESKWTTNLGMKIKRFTGVVAAISFLVAVMYIREKAFYVVGGMLFISSLAEYFLLETRAEIAKNLLALFMIVGFMVGDFFVLGFFGPGVAALALFLFLISFVVLVWGGGMEYLWRRIKKRYGE
ncbi:MAG: hypothetical protein HXS40_04115 [Theionarchaea archaeon]|nr:hypothetical protein [Theionarchaea archaeon]